MTTEIRDCFFSKTSSGSHPNENVAPSAQLQTELISSVFL
jgi:hypothetical protein